MNHLLGTKERSSSITHSLANQSDNIDFIHGKIINCVQVCWKNHSREVILGSRK